VESQRGGYDGGGVFEGARGQLEVIRVAAGEGADGHTLDLARHGIDTLPIPPRCGRKSCLNDIRAELAKRAGYTQLLGLAHATPGRPLAVAQRGIENQHTVWSPTELSADGDPSNSSMSDTALNSATRPVSFISTAMRNKFFLPLLKLEWVAADLGSHGCSS